MTAKPNPTPDLDTCRIAFEMELSKHPLELLRRHRDQFAPNNYGDMHTQAAWEMFRSAWYQHESETAAERE